MSSKIKVGDKCTFQKGSHEKPVEVVITKVATGKTWDIIEDSAGNESIDLYYAKVENESK